MRKYSNVQYAMIRPSEGHVGVTLPVCSCGSSFCVLIYMHLLIEYQHQTFQIYNTQPKIRYKYQSL